MAGKNGWSVPDPKKYSETGAKMRRNQLLIFSRWCQVMLRFEKAMYENPGQDLNNLWWETVEKYSCSRDRPAAASPITPARSTSSRLRLITTIT